VRIQQSVHVPRRVEYPYDPKGIAMDPVDDQAGEDEKETMTPICEIFPHMADTRMLCEF